MYLLANPTQVAILQLQSVLTLNHDEFVPFNVLKYITGEMIYGGRVTDDFDRRCLMSIVSRLFSSEATQDTYFYGNSQVIYLIIIMNTVKME